VFEWLPGRCYAVIKAFWMVLFILLCCCLRVWVVARALLCSYKGILNGSWYVALQFLGHLSGCQGVAMHL